MTSATLTYGNWNAPLYPLQKAQVGTNAPSQSYPDIRIRRTKAGWNVTDVVRKESRTFQSEADIRNWLDDRF